MQVAALQEASNAPPPRSHWTHRVFPNPGVTEHLWNIGTHDRPDLVNIYWVDSGQQRNGLAILSRASARNAVQLPVNGRFNSRPMMGVQFGNDWYFTAHALLAGLRIRVILVMDFGEAIQRGEPVKESGDQVR